MAKDMGREYLFIGTVILLDCHFHLGEVVFDIGFLEREDRGNLCVAYSRKQHNRQSHNHQRQHQTFPKAAAHLGKHFLHRLSQIMIGKWGRWTMLVLSGPIFSLLFRPQSRSFALIVLSYHHVRNCNIDPFPLSKERVVSLYERDGVKAQDGVISRLSAVDGSAEANP